MIILDTSILIDLLKGEKKVTSYIQNLKETHFAISIITLAELELGFHFLSSKKQSETKKKLSKLIQDKTIQVIPVDAKVTVWYGKIQSLLKSKGKILSQFDGLIAATALTYSYTLLTTDTDFLRVTQLNIMRDVLDLAGTFKVKKNKPFLKARERLEKQYKRV